MWAPCTPNHLLHHIHTFTHPLARSAPVPTHVPCLNTQRRGQGTEGLRKFYAHHFIPKMPADVQITPLERNVGVDAKGGETVVDEFLFSFTHMQQMDWMLPGVAPTGKKVCVPFIVVVKFEGDKLKAERIYWDQATVLRQIGLLPELPCVSGPEQAAKAADHKAAPSNALIEAAAAAAAGVGTA